jgi:xanthine dehydrogenase accessory factor
MLDDAVLREIEKLQRAGTPFCVANIVDGRGSIPQIVGASAIFTEDGLAHGTVGGGALEEMCRKTAQELLGSGRAVKTHFRRCNLQRDLGMTCGGWVALYFEVHRRELDWNIAIFGAGHVAQVLCRFLIELECQVTCIDTREEWLGRLPRSGKLQTCHVADYRDGLERIAPGSDVILMTMGHGSDLPVLRAIHEKKIRIAQLGVIGSDGKSKAMRRQLLEAGIPREFVDRILCPVGEKLGNNTPPEIAVGIVSQFLKLRQAAQVA